MVRCWLYGLTFCCLAVAGDASAAERVPVTIGTGGQTGVYYEIGQSVCRLLNRAPGPPQMRCTAPATGGSVANINAVHGGQMTLGLAQSDTQYQAVKGLPPFVAAMGDLRAVFSVHAEPLTVVARDDSGIAGLDDLKGKRVNIGSRGSGQRATFEALMAELGWQPGDLALAGEWGATEQAQALCDGRVDAIVYAVGHPNGAITEATTACAAHLVPIQGPAVERLLAGSPYYAAVSIPAGLYQGTAGEVPTFGVVATMVVSSAAADDVVGGVVETVFANLDRLRQMHPALATLDAKRMATVGLSAPLHSGAAKYFEASGLR